jgi:hypothetical protein
MPIEVSMDISTSRLVWSDATSVGPACNAEWVRHSMLTHRSDAGNVKLAAINVQRLVSALNSGVPKDFVSCAEVAIPGMSVQREAFVHLAVAIKNFMSSDVNNAQTSWSPVEVSGQACALHCNVCSSGWAGTIVGEKNLVTGGNRYFTQTQTFYIGGASSSNPNKLLAEWTTDGSGKFVETTASSTTTKEWKLSADVAGKCDPLGDAACIQALPQALPQGNVISFLEINSTISQDKAYELTTKTQGGTSSTDPYTVWEDGINSFSIKTPATSSTAQDSYLQTTNCQRPPQDSAPMSSCTLLWTWTLFKQ